MSKVVFDRDYVSDLLVKILDTLPDGYTVRLLLDKDDDPHSWVCLGDMGLSRATQVINSAMVEAELSTQPPTQEGTE